MITVAIAAVAALLGLGLACWMAEMLLLLRSIVTTLKDIETAVYWLGRDEGDGGDEDEADDLVPPVRASGSQTPERLS